jgi:hypothetical protein
MVFIYVYYGLFVCKNLVDVMSLFFTDFLFHLSIFNKNRSVSGKNHPISLFLCRLLCVSAEFSQFSSIFIKIFKNRRDR